MIFRVSLAFLAFASSCSSLMLQCNYHMTSWTVIGTKYTCDGTLTSSDSAEYNIDSVSGGHLGGRTNDDVEVVNIIANRGINRLASNLDTFFPHLVGLRWFDGNLSWIDFNDLRPFPNLQLISFRGNQLVSLDSDLFEFNSKLRFLSFRDNLLENVGNDFLTSLTSLEQVAFSNNPCIDVFATNSHAIEELNQQLPISCPPLLKTTIMTTEQCSDGCAIKIEALEQEIGLEIATLKSQSIEQISRIEELEETIELLKNQINKLRSDFR